MNEHEQRSSLIPLLALVAILAVLAGMCPFDFGCSRERARRSKCQANLHQIGLACSMYVADNKGRFPMTLSSISTNYAANPKLFLCPSSGNLPGAPEAVDQWSDYILVPDLTTNDPPDTILAYERLRNHKEGGNVLSLDGAVDWRSAEEYGKLKTKTGKLLKDQ